MTDMWACLFFVLTFRTVLSSPPKPTNVTFTSVNLRNILKWSPGKDTPADTKYRVRYAIYGDIKEGRAHWRPVLHCMEITRTWCDLSKETSDLEESYYAKIRAVSRKNNSEWVWSKNFSPKIDTEFGPPHVSVEVDDKYAIITIEGPMKYLPNNQTPQLSMATLYPQMIYNLSIQKVQSKQIRHFTLTGNQYKYRTMDPGTEVCFSATTKLMDRYSKHHSSAWHCITTPEVPLIDRLERIVIICTIVPAVLLTLLIAGSYVLYKYLLGTDQASPVILRMPTFFPLPLPMPSENINIIVIPGSKDDVPFNKLYPKLQNPSTASQRREASPLIDLQSPEEEDYGLKVGQSGVKNQNYSAKEWQIVPKSESIETIHVSQQSLLQLLSSSVNSELLSQSGENWQAQTLCENTKKERSNDNEGEIVVSSDYASQNVCPVQLSNQLHDLPDDYGFVSSSGYASQNAHSMQPLNRSNFLPDIHGLEGFAAIQEAQDSSLHIDWSPTTHRLVIPGLDLGIGHGEGEGLPRNGVHLDTVFVRQPSEEEARLEVERGGSGQWDAEEFMAKWDLVLSND